MIKIWKNYQRIPQEILLEEEEIQKIKENEFKPKQFKSNKDSINKDSINENEEFDQNTTRGA
jgi:hypothetical protein